MNGVRIPEIGSIVRRIARRKKGKDRTLIVLKEIERRNIEKDRSHRKNIRSMKMCRKKKDKETDTEKEMATETETGNVTPIVNKKRTIVLR